MSKEIRCLHCELAFNSRRAYVDHCKVAHTGVFVEIAMPWYGKAAEPSRSTTPKKPPKRSGRVREAKGTGTAKPKKNPNKVARVVRVSSEFQPKGIRRVKRLAPSQPRKRLGPPSGVYGRVSRRRPSVFSGFGMSPSRSRPLQGGLPGLGGR